MQKQFLTITAVLLLLNIIGCHTYHSQQRYYLKHFRIIVHKYGWQLGKITYDSVTAKYKVPTRKQTNDFLAFAEHNMAMWPDSLWVSNNSILEIGEDGQSSLKEIPGSRICDSFYTHPAKIEYIKKHHLESPHIHFLIKN
jgi:hypothetical protein